MVQKNQRQARKRKLRLDLDLSEYSKQALVSMASARGCSTSTIATELILNGKTAGVCAKQDLLRSQMSPTPSAT